MSHELFVSYPSDSLSVSDDQTTTTGFVHIMTDNGFRFKVGASRNPDERLLQFKTSNLDIKHVARFFVHNYLQAEHVAHQQLSKWHLELEWFLPPNVDEICAQVSKAIAQFQTTDELSRNDNLATTQTMMQKKLQEICLTSLRDNLFGNLTDVATELQSKVETLDELCKQVLQLSVPSLNNQVVNNHMNAISYVLNNTNKISLRARILFHNAQR